MPDTDPQEVLDGIASLGAEHPCTRCRHDINQHTGSPKGRGLHCRATITSYPSKKTLTTRVCPCPAFKFRIDYRD